jgi:hypothetical protein
MLKITVELPIEDGEVIVNAIERAANEGDAAAGLVFAAIGRSDLPIDTVRRLCCDGSVVVVTEDERGAPLDVGRKQRIVSTPIKRALWSRDRGCTFPGCPNRHYIDAHHVRHWADGGETSIENLTLLCSHHHRALHEGRFAIRRDALGAIYFQRPDGRVIPKGGYRLDDLLDDDAETGDGAVIGENPSAEGYSVLDRDYRDSAGEVRESAAVYSIRRSALALADVSARRAHPR